MLAESHIQKIAPLNGKPHVVFVATRVPYPPVTGHYLRTLNILRGLAQRFSVHFFGFRDVIHGTRDDHALGEETLRSICASVYIEDVGAERSKARLLLDLVTSLLTCQPFTARKYFSGTMRQAIQAVFERYEIAVVHADSLPSGQYLVDAPFPKLLTNHNVEYLRLYRYASQRGSRLHRLALWIQGWLTKRYEGKIMDSFGNCVAVSEEDKKELSSLAPDVRFFVVPNGTDTSEPLLPSAEQTALSALWVGGMNDEFNREAVIHFAFRILPRILEQVPEFKWIVVGRDPPAWLRTLAAEPSSGVVLTGFVPVVRDAYEQSAIVVAPMVSGGGTKLKVLEAMAMGRAVVTTPVGAEGIAVRDGVEMEIASNDEEFARRVVALLFDPARRRQMAAAARTVAEREYSWEVINHRMLAAVRAVMCSCPHGEAAACAE